MLETLRIQGFKSIDEQTFELKPLTVLTGLNSSGKSSVIQALLLLSSSLSKSTELNSYIKKFSDFNEVRNKYTNAKLVNIFADEAESHFRIIYNMYPKNEQGLSTDFEVTSDWNTLEFETNLHYISSNRIGQEDIASFDNSIKFGIDGKYAFSYFEQYKDKKVEDNLLANKTHNTLDAQLSYWLEYILGIELRVVTQKITQSNVKVVFNSESLESISPFNLGAGNSYLAKILIIGLACKPNNIFIVENPEIHLHPKAQSKLADFFVFLVNAGVQVVIETHSEHFINKLRYNTYKKKIKAEDTNIYYKPSTKEKFINIKIDNNGHFTDKDGQKTEFPQSFFDATLSELLEMM